MEPEAVGSSAARCPTCSAPVEPDWLTCRSCGAILAAVRRPASAAAGPAPQSAEIVPGWPPPPQPPAAPSPPSTPAVHTAAIPVSAAPVANPELGPNQWYSSRAGADAAEAPATAPAPTPEPKAGIFADLPLAIPETAGGRVAGVGLAAIAIAFVLPWSPLLPGISLFDAWGFSRSSRVVVFLVDLVLLFLLIQPVGLSTRVRTGWLPALFGIFVVGVFWERVDAISVVGPGAWLFAIGGLMSLVGGLLTLVGHESGPSGSAPA